MQTSTSETDEIGISERAACLREIYVYLLSRRARRLSVIGSEEGPVTEGCEGRNEQGPDRAA
jgi:hypothetical protein